MIWEEYEAQKARYSDAQKQYAELVEQKEVIFQKTQPSAVRYDKDVVTGGGAENPLEAYAIQIERLEMRLSLAHTIVENNAYLLKRKREDLMDSPDFRDKVYRMRYLQRMRVVKIAEIVHYSEPTVWRTLRQIAKERKVDRI